MQVGLNKLLPLLKNYSGSNYFYRAKNQIMRKYLLIISLFFLSCNNGPKTNPSASAPTTAQDSSHAITYDKIKCNPGEYSSVQSQTNPAISFTVYCPKNYIESQNFPIIYFFDPHADGKLPLEKYRIHADEMNIILAGCNSSKNGMSMEESETAAKAMIADCRNRLPINSEVQIVAGFSGGSKVACVTAMQNHFLSGLIACSGSVFDKNSFSDSLAIVSMAGQKDFNYHEMTAFNNAVTNNPHIYIETENTHEWPPADAMKMAFQFEILNAISKNKIPKDQQLLQQWHNEWNTTIAQHEKKNDVFITYQTLQNAVEAFKGLSDVASWQNKLSAIEKSADYSRYVTKQRNLIYQEKEMQKMLNDAFVNQNISWWEKEITDLKTGEKQTNDPLIAALNGRLLGYIGIAAYSYSNQLVNENLPDADKVLSIYKTAEPENAEAWFLSAVYHANNNQNELAMQDFQKSLTLGFKEQSRINDYPRLKNLIAP